MKYLLATMIVAILQLSEISAAQAQMAFSFETPKDIPQMKAVLQKALPLQSDRTQVENTLSKIGKATRVVHPTNTHLEKYIYDINLCEMYVWRWNIAAAYDDADKLSNLYVNGTGVYNAAYPETFKKSPPRPGNTEKIMKAFMPRPEASKGEKTLAYLLYDQDGNTDTIDDQYIMGGAPTNADAANFGKLMTYTDVPSWLSIFSTDKVPVVRSSSCQ